MAKPVLYIDIDDTIIANCNSRSGFDLRPNVMTQLRILSRLFRCRWLTCWPWKSSTKGRPMDIQTLMRNLYGTKLNQDITYCDWGHGHEWRKAGAVLAEGAPQDFYWLEDPLCHEEIEALEKAGKLDRYIRVEPCGNWAFADACLELFRRAGITEADIKAVGGRIEWFQKEAVIQENSGRDNLIEHLSMVKLMSQSSVCTPEEMLANIRNYVDTQIKTLYPEPSEG